MNAIFYTGLINSHFQIIWMLMRESNQVEKMLILHGLTPKRLTDRRSAQCSGRRAHRWKTPFLKISQSRTFHEQQADIKRNHFCSNGNLIHSAKGKMSRILDFYLHSYFVSLINVRACTQYNSRCKSLIGISHPRSLSKLS